ncbi:diguanylate cyclase/phosphodiesterase [Rhizobium sp. RU20A]|uniref:EAL domain-containing protein n=1 Tax=Rhizobium sp. RU20A TaxID=1907412 RepID=UPI0009543881|nr:EAL domain-containing protein [Rhizobium sp. RU20A]SIQ26652.1 diguanylate cyclase/phosphodiesterase [Rhizobium sp. RU20A]
MHSVENRFLAIVTGTALLVVVPLLIFYFMLTSERVVRERMTAVDVLMGTASESLGKPMWDLDSPSVRRIANSLLVNDVVTAVVIRDTSGTININARASGGSDKSSGEIRTTNINYLDRDGSHYVGTLSLTIDPGAMHSGFQEGEVSMLAILLLSVGVVFAAAIIGNRLIVMRPLTRLTAAIEATDQLGSRHRVDWHSRDEMGALAASFNRMQDKLEREEHELKRAHDRAAEIYNGTPAMLFSLDSLDRITAVSDYWLAATGYQREEVIGRPFTELLDPASHETYRDRTSAESGADAFTCEVTLPLRKADGSWMTVLILETTEPTGDTEASSLSVMTDVTALKAAESRNLSLAITDHLTGQLNRQGFEAALDGSIRSADETGQQLACLFIDLDRFKWINDNLGHAAGDTLLRKVVARCREHLRGNDIMARLGGDEFAILISAMNAQTISVEIGERICAELREPFNIAGTDVSISASMGMAVYPAQADSAADLILKADMAMYDRKRAGKNGLRVFDSSMFDDARERHEIELSIEAALRNNWLETHLQPIISLRNGMIVGFEALMRINHPDRGLISPAKIIAIAEENGSIGRIGERIMEQSIEHLARISTLEGTDGTYVAINFSPLQFDISLPSRLAALLLKHHIAPKRVVIEITEAVLMLDNPDVHAVLSQLSEFGCQIALDDFGTGYSSLSYLSRFPVDIVKVDQSFTRALTTGNSDARRKSRMLIKGIRTISHQMGCSVVAEGVETGEQAELLGKLGIDFGQGYLFSRPMNIDKTIEMLESESEAKDSSQEVMALLENSA